MSEQWRVVDLCGFEGALRAVRGGVEVCPEGGTSTLLPVAELDAGGADEDAEQTRPA